MLRGVKWSEKISSSPHLFLRETMTKIKILNLTSKQFKTLDRKLDQIMSDLSALTAAVEESTTVEQSAIALLNTLAADLEAVKTDPAAIQTIADNIRNNSASLAAAVTANTPASPPPPAEPTA
jgi:hypothetical protein